MTQNETPETQLPLPICSACGRELGGVYRMCGTEAFHAAGACLEAWRARLRGAAVEEVDGDVTAHPPLPSHAALEEAGQLRLPGLSRSLEVPDPDLRAGEGRKGDSGKPQWGLLPFRAVGEVVQVLTHGAQKYAPDNWRKVPGGRRRYLDAALRHIAAWAMGERLDRDSGLPHLAHAACCVLFLLELDRE